MPPSEIPAIIGAAQACELLDIDRSTLTRWVASGRVVPIEKLPGLRGAFLFRRDEIEALTEQEEASA